MIRLVAAALALEAIAVLAYLAGYLRGLADALEDPDRGRAGRLGD